MHRTYQSERNIWKRNVNSIIFHETNWKNIDRGLTKECSTLNPVVGLDLFRKIYPFIPSENYTKFWRIFWQKKIHWTKQNKVMIKKMSLKKKIHRGRENRKTFSRVINRRCAVSQKPFRKRVRKELAAISWNSYWKRREKLYVTYSIKCWLHEHEFFFKLSLWYRCELSQVYIM